ncbi:formate dehydrogenase subunit gamma [Zavarzinia compransoris]|uniref:Formate dehydrogenase subunit gamma n=1 Tax=Zavarzinia compransoris TaxID=1264899 RepID=A0A317E7S9_9PROT|nr:formate dehydrogenase subunit gamma [Zavarzinia compransoris]PWR23188.1 formate dehydrogenase subunit gamma [Zavarzinia compransoris]TDP46254.1 formate dehydrogenase gamma subunit [Zavarzinia compransoris]
MQAASDRSRLEEIIARFAGIDGATLPVLHAIQDDFGHIPEAAIQMIADAENRSRAEIHGVVSFYHDFRAVPAGRRVIKLCRAEACQSMGGEAIAARIAAHLGLEFGETARDGSITLENIYCLGLCATAPAALVDGKPVGRLTEARAERLLREVAP